MANTVNDVMNVIASPDYGIKNIAGTTQEILAILTGTHNSQNNIHNIVDDVRNLLQELVDVTNEKKKPIDIDNKSTKISQKHIQDILDETKGIRKAIIGLEKAIMQQSKGTKASVVKLSDKASEKVANAMVKNIDKANKGGGLSALVDAFNKLKDISLKDIIFGNLKLKKLTEIFKTAKNDLNIKEKDLNNIIKFINAAPEMIKSLSKISWRINLIIKNDIIKKIGQILVGKDSLLTISRSFQKNEKTFNIANKVAADIKSLISHLNISMMTLLFTSMFAKSAVTGIKSIDTALEKLIPLANKLAENKKNIKDAAKVAKNITTLAGNLLLSSILLTVGAANAITAIIGAMLLNVMVGKISSTADKLIENKKSINEGAKVAKHITTLAGNLFISSALLSICSVNVIPAIIGSLLLNLMVGRVVSLSKKLIKNKKDISAGAKLAKNIETLISSLNTSMMKLSFISIWVKLSSKGIESVDSMLNKLIPLANKLAENKKSINEGSKAAKNISSLSGHLLITSILLSIGAATGYIAQWGVEFLDVMVDKIIGIAEKLSKNQKDINKGTKIAKNITVLVGNLLLSSIILTIGAATGIPAILGSLFLMGMVGVTISITESLVENEKNISKGTKVAKNITVLVGNLLASSILLTIGAATGIPAILGSLFLMGMVISISVLSDNLIENDKNINKASKVAKNITVLVGNLLTTSIFLTIAAVTSVTAMVGALLLWAMVALTSRIADKLSKEEKDMSKAVGSALVLTAFTGLMLITSLLLVAVAATGIKAIIGAGIMLAVVSICSLTFNMLSKAKKETLTGALVMLVMSASLIFFGIALKKITEATKDVNFKQVLTIAAMTVIFSGVIIALGVPQVAALVALGSVSMSLMSISLILFGTALGKISKATENLKMKQVTLVAKSMMVLGLGIAAMGILSIPIMLGSIALGAAVLALRPFVNVLGSIEKITKNLQMKHIKLVNKSMLELALGIAAMSTLYIPVIIGSATVLAIGVGLRPFVKTLGLISEATAKLKMKHIRLVNQSMLELALGISAMSVLFLPVTFGSATVLAMGIALRPFVKTLKTISELGSVPTKLVRQVVNSLKIVGNFFKNNPIDSDAVKNAKKYRKMMRPFINTVSQLVKLKEMGSVPIKLVQQTLKAMRTIANYYVENPIKKKVIKQARRYKRMMRPFGHMIEHLSKLKNMGSIPIKLVQQTLKAMRTIANYYVENPIERKVIKQARRYKRMMRPFGHMVDHLSKLKNMGSIPIKLVQQTLRAMRTIANYYMENPIERKVIKQSRQYKRMLKPFGTTIENLSKLKQMGSIPMKLVQQTLNAMSAIADFYQNLDMNSSKGTLNASILSAIMTSFGKTTESMKGIKGLKSVPTEAVESITASASNIIMFYNTAYFEDINSIDEKSRLTELVVNKFINVAMNIQDNFANIKRIDFKSLYYIISACRSIINYYRFTEFDATTSTKVPLMNNAIKLFSESTEYLKTIEFDNINNIDIIFAIISLKRIIKYYSTFKRLPSEKRILRMNNAIKLFSENIEYLKVIDLKTNNVASIDTALKSMKRILKFLKTHSLNSAQNIKAKQSISILKDVASAMSNLSNINSSNMTSIGSAISNALSGVNAVDMDQVEAVTNMFNAFNKISKSENVINKFTESVKEFTETCKDLMNAMGNNTDAINNIDMSGNRNSGSIFSNIKDKVYDFVSGESDNNTNQTNGIRITNVDEVARAIAEKINGALSVDVPDAQIQLLINGTGGNEWTISRY